MGKHKLTGRCMCEAVTVEATSARASISACHCDMCRQWTSSMLMTIPVEAGSVQATGPVKTFSSSDWAERAFCETCGSPLWYRFTQGDDAHMQMQLSAGLFENSGGFDLKFEIFTDRKPAGYAFAGERRQMTQAEVVAAFATSTEDDA